MQEAAQLSEAGAWLANLGKALDARDIPGALELFVEDCYWRDFLSLTWNIKTMEGKPAIASMLEATLERASPTEWVIEKVVRAAGVIEAWFAFTTRAGRGRGHLSPGGREVPNDFDDAAIAASASKSRSASRALWGRHIAPTRGRQNWTEKLAADQAALGVSEQPYCLIIGGGQGRRSC